MFSKEFYFVKSVAQKSLQVINRSCLLGEKSNNRRAH